MAESNRVALVTGASRGLGRVIARVLAHAATTSSSARRDRDALAARPRELISAAPAVLPVAGDITDARCARTDRCGSASSAG